MTGTAVSAGITGCAALIAVGAGLEVWIMLLGLLAYSSRGASTRDGAANYLCLLLGLVLGMVAETATEALEPRLGGLATPVVVAMTTCVILPLRHAPVINNPTCFFLGLTAVIASGAIPGVSAYVLLAATSAIGAIAGWATESAQARLHARP